MDQITAAAARVAAKRTELSTRLDELHKAPAYMKIHAARIVAATIFELLQHQSTFNDAAIGELSRLSSRVALLEQPAAAAGSPALRL